MTTSAILATEAPDAMSITQSNQADVANEPADAASNGSASGPTTEQRWNAVMARDDAFDGKFVFGVSSTGVYCRPSCAARRPRRENVTFFLGPEQAELAGYRACLRCKPKSAGIHPESDSVKRICRYIEQHLDEPITLERLG